MIKVHCDHCGVEISTEDYQDCDIETARNYFSADLCRDCAEQLDSIIKDFLNRRNN